LGGFPVDGVVVGTVGGLGVDDGMTGGSHNSEVFSVNQVQLGVSDLDGLNRREM